MTKKKGTLTEEDVTQLRKAGRRIKKVDGRWVDIETSEILGTDQSDYNQMMEKMRAAVAAASRSDEIKKRILASKENEAEENEENSQTHRAPIPETVINPPVTISPKPVTPPPPPPGVGPTRETITDALLSGAKVAAIENDQGSIAKHSSGFQNTSMAILEPQPLYNQTNAEKVIQGKTNTFIIMGRDRPAGVNSGKGAGANTNVGCIDIIAGLSGITARETDQRGQPVATNKSTELDSARIYISQRADIDSPEYFNLAEGKVGNLTNRSAIAVKADSVRIIGREGIKLVTSTDQYSGAAGFFIGDNIQGIDLIAGNDDSDLQPLVKGDDLEKVLNNITELISDLHGTVAFLLEVISNMIGEQVMLAAATGGAAGGSGSKYLPRLIQETINLSLQEMNFVYHDLNYSSQNPFAKYNFRSRYNNVN